MGLRKSETISLRKLCADVGIGYQGIWNNLKRKMETRTITEDQKQSIFKQLDKEVVKFKKKFYE